MIAHDHTAPESRIKSRAFGFPSPVSSLCDYNHILVLFGMQTGLEVKIQGYEARRTLDPVLATCSRLSGFVSLSLSFLICKMGENALREVFF